MTLSADLYANQPSPEQLAEQLAAVAGAHGIGTGEILLWVHDRPRHEMSATHFVSWCRRYGLIASRSAAAMRREISGLIGPAFRPLIASVGSSK